MSHRDQNELNLGLDPLPEAPAPPKPSLTISASAKKPLSPAQVEFNKRMKALEKERAAHERERSRLDEHLRVCITELMPMIETMNRAEHDLIRAVMQARITLKLTPKRHKWLGDLMSCKASDLLADSQGLSREDLDHLEALIEKLGPSLLDEERKEIEQEELDDLCDMIEEMARQAGVKLDLDGIDRHEDPAEFERQIRERFAEAIDEHQNATNGKTPLPKNNRKSSKATLERERLRQEVEDAKSRDFKSLYKQLAKVLHPDLETDPLLKSHKEIWMKRLNTAHANGDLRDMLAIEMEWLGEEAGNLTQASDEKLRIYSMVLKEQLAELKMQTSMLFQEPQYYPLQRFLDRFGKRQNPVMLKLKLSDEIAHLEEITTILRLSDTHTRTMLHQWADAHARECSR
jgi:hypothetical protein